MSESEPTTPLQLTVDDIAGAKLAATRALNERMYGEHRWYNLLGVLNLAIGSSHLVLHMSDWFGWFSIAVGVLWIAMARLRPQMRRPIVPTAFTVDRDGITYTVRGHAASHAYAWRDLSTVRNTRDALVVTLRFSAKRWNRTIFVPKPPDIAVADAMWAMFYQHLVAQRGLQPSHAGRLSVITNTAFA